MKLEDRYKVDGTEPAMYIGHRVYRTDDGSIRISRKWYAEWCVDAKQRCRSLSTSIKNVAIDKAREIAKAIREGEVVQIKRNLPIKSLVDQYVQYQQDRRRAPKTLEKYGFALQKNFVQWTDSIDKTNSATFNAQDLWSYSAHLIGKGKSEKTVYDRLTLVKQMFKWAVKNRLLRIDPLAAEDLQEPPPTKQKCFTADQVAKLLDAALMPNKAIYAVLAYCGLRIGELQQLRWCDITFDDADGGTIKVERGGSAGTTTKGRESRTLHMHPDLRVILERLPREHELIFVQKLKRTGEVRPVDERALLAELKLLCAKCGFDEPQKYKLHSFRHTFASMLVQSRAPERYVLAAMGHKSSEILTMYVSLYDDVAKQLTTAFRYPIAKGGTDASTPAA